jgi:hypothetical protein
MNLGELVTLVVGSVGGSAPFGFKGLVTDKGRATTWPFTKVTLLVAIRLLCSVHRLRSAPLKVKGTPMVEPRASMVVLVEAEVKVSEPAVPVRLFDPARVNEPPIVVGLLSAREAPVDVKVSEPPTERPPLGTIAAAELTVSALPMVVMPPTVKEDPPAAVP